MKEKVIYNKDLKYHYLVRENSDVFNLDNDRYIKPSKDKRRPNEPPAIYFKRKDGTREFWYHDILIATCFIDGYNSSMYVHHKDGDVKNCELDNLYVSDGLSVLREIHHETKEWKKVVLEDTYLYYDYYICEDGRLFNATTNSFLVPFIDKRPSKAENYKRYNLYTSKLIKDVIHVSTGRLVALHFIPRPEGKNIVLYLDNDLSNVDRSNLCWGDNWDALNKEVFKTTDRSFTSLKLKELGKEKWKPVVLPGHELACEYMVSNFGRVYNKTKGFYCAENNNGVPNKNNQYHKTVNINVLNHERTFIDVLVHRLVAMHFCKNDDPKRKVYVNHINGNPSCNLAMNLEWATPFENLHHAIETNLISNSLYEGTVDEKYWRLNTIFAWIYSLKNITDERAFNIYEHYRTEYEDNIPKLTFDEFVNEFNTRLKENKDFQRIYKFYTENYL